MDAVSKKKFFENIATLPLAEKVATVYEVFTKPEDKEEADQIVLSLIGRNKETSLIEKEELIQKYFPDNAQELFLQTIEVSRQKPHNLKNQLHLGDYIKKNMSEGGLLDFGKNPPLLEEAHGTETKRVRLTRHEKNKRFLNTIAAFLTQKREDNEYVDKTDCKLIMDYLIVNLYNEYQDQMNSIIHVGFRFKRQRIKQLMSKFYDEVIASTGKIDKVLFLNLLRGAYLSEEVYTLLVKYADLISDDKSLGEDVIIEVEKLKEEDLNASKKELEMIEHALSLLNKKMAQKYSV